MITKGSAWATIHFSLMVLAIGAHYQGWSRELWPGLVAAMVANGAAYITGQVADNGVKGAFYNPNLDKGVQ